METEKQTEKQMVGASQAEQFFEDSLKRVESASIREWASSERNRPIWLELAGTALKNKGPSADPDTFAACIVATAIGL